MNDDFPVGLILGVLVGTFITYHVWSAKFDVYKAPMDIAIAKCEAELPRNQECYIEYNAKVKQK